MADDLEKYKELLDDLGEEVEPVATGSRSAKEQRVIAGFEEIVRWTEEHGRPPQHSESRDIFERLYAVRLDSIRASAECRVILETIDTRGLLGPATDEPGENCLEEPRSAEALLAELGVTPDAPDDVTKLVHVRTRDEIRAAEEIAQRNPCKDFASFKTLFEAVQRELESGTRQTLPYKDNADAKQGDLFILDGQKVLVAALGEPFVSDYGRPDRRLRVVYDNGTESDLLLRSLQRALNKDKASRRITEPNLGPLFSAEDDPDDLPSGHIYVLRSLSDDAFVAQHRDVIHKIGVTGGDVKSRVANAKKDPTYLLAEVKIVATFKLANINRKKLETLLHTFFAEARLDLSLKDRFGAQVEPREWFLISLPVIEEAIGKLVDGTIGEYRYDTPSACIIKKDTGIIPRERSKR
jgi:hypothetical protein